MPPDLRSRPQPFVAMVIHDLQGPVGVIRSLTELLLQGGFGELRDEQRHVLRDVEATAVFLIDLARNAVDLARASAQTLTLEPRPFDLTTTVRTVVNSMSSFAASRSVTVKIEAPATCIVQLDALRVGQIVYNYVFNAIKFTPRHGYVTARLSAAESDVLIEVIDSGIGMAPGDSDRLYSAFTKLDGGRPFEPYGAGLGLAVTRALVEAHGGSVGARSADGAGSVFWARLPRQATSAPPRAPLAQTLDDLSDAIGVIDTYAKLAFDATEPGTPQYADLVQIVEATGRATELSARASGAVGT